MLFRSQVQINTESPGLAPAEVEKRVTFPVEVALGGLPDVTEIRSLSQYGLSQVTVVFADATDIYFARQQISERLASVRADLPPNIAAPELAPVSTGLGEIYQYTLSSPTRTATDLRTWQDFVVKPALRTVTGVAEINSQGGYENQFQILVDPKRLLSRGVSVREVVEAVEQGNSNAGGGYVLRGAEQLVVRGVGAAANRDDLLNTVIAAERGTPVLVRDVASVIETGNTLRRGAATAGGKETVLGIVMMRKGENTRTVAQAIAEQIKAVQKSLPHDVKLTPVYNRTELVDKTIHTVQKNLLEGGVLVIAVLLLLLGNVRGAIIAATVIPLSMLFAVIGMERFGVSANLLSLGAIDFGLIVDGAVIMVENCVRRLAEARERKGKPLTDIERRETVADACREVRQATQFGEMIILVTYLPILTLTGVEGKMFQPMALTVIFALTGALVLSLTVVPALCSLLLSGDTHEKPNWFLRGAERLYRPALSASLR